MKKLILLSTLAFLLFAPLSSMARAGGYSMAFLMDDGSEGVIVLAKFRSQDFFKSEVNSWATQLSQALQGFGYGSNAWVFNHDQLGDPDALRSVLGPLYNYYQTIFMEVSKGPARVAGAISQNIWVDLSYENMRGMYIGSLGFQEEALSQLGF